MRDFALIGVSQTASLIMGGVFAGAAVTFAEIVRGGDALPVRLSAWVLGITASITALDGYVRRGLIEGRPVLYAVPMVGLGGVLSMVGFALLGPQTGGADGWRYSQLVMLVVGALFSQSWSKTFAHHVEPALRPLYEAHTERTRRRALIFRPILVAAALPFAMAVIDKFTAVPLQWPIAIVNLTLSAFYVFSLLMSQRYYAGLYDRVYAVHTAKLSEAKITARPASPRPRKRRTVAG
jgi:hypothetical protein